MSEIKPIEIIYTCRKCNCSTRKNKKPLTEKKCKTCNEIKPIIQFNSNGKVKLGQAKKYKNQCKDCIKETSRMLYLKRKQRKSK